MPRRFEGQRLATQYVQHDRGSWECRARAILGKHPDGRRNEPRATFRGSKAECARQAQDWYDKLLEGPEPDTLGTAEQTLET